MTHPLPRLILLCGLPGAGKTTLGRRLEASVPALRLSPDEWLADLGHSLYDEPARERVEALSWRIAQRVLALGGSVVLESGFWSRVERDETRATARALGVRVELRFLDVPLDELWRRIARRNASEAWTEAPITRRQLEGWARAFEAPDAAELSLFDTPGDAPPEHPGCAPEGGLA